MSKVKKQVKSRLVSSLRAVCIMAWACLLLFEAAVCTAADSLCAIVKIEIRQELTLERQAFNAHMRISNGLSHLALENVNVTVVFTDESGNAVVATSDPGDTSARFFIREDSKTNINDINGSGSVAPSTSADINWLIIPAPGASNGLERGKRYNVGATLKYTLGGKVDETTVSPDYIFVKPMPQIVLDYFLPMEVYGDDAFTDAIEPSVPFSLGVRVRNNGRGTARNLKIESAQPIITENEQGLLIGFAIQGSQVNGQPTEKTLLVDFGDVGPGMAAMARWLMTCSLSGRFVEFDTDFSHSDELGGAVTSLIDTIQTHFLVHDVWVDVVGRDRIPDFLAKDGDMYRVYESDGIDTQIDDQSAFSTLTSFGLRNGLPAYALTTPVNHGFAFVQLTDPFRGKKIIHSAIRSDGKIIKPENIWLSKFRVDKNWEYTINLFDATTTGKYTITFEEPPTAPEAPVLQYIADVTAIEGERISFVVQASDPDGTTPVLSLAGFPAGSRLMDNGNGTASFDWTPVIGQAGSYIVTFKASDEALETCQRVLFSIRSIADTDGDGMQDAWEMEWFGTLGRDGTGDFDGDDVNDLDEYLAGSDPAAQDHAPTIPKVLSPGVGESVATSLPQLGIENSSDLDNDQITYEFELYSDQRFHNMVVAGEKVIEETTTTHWTIPVELIENHHYFWRVRAADGYSYSLWAYGDFIVNAIDEPPQGVTPSFPPESSEVDTRSPTLEVIGARDPDQETLFCSFEVYEETTMQTLVTDAHGIVVLEDGVASWDLDVSLTDGRSYYWRAIVTDNQGLATKTELSDFTVNTANQAPSMPVIDFPIDGEEIAAAGVELMVTNAADSEADALYYSFEIDTNSHFNSSNKYSSDLINEGINSTSWQVLNLKDNTSYYWRAKATDQTSASPWVVGRFFVNVDNNRPHVPNLKNPGEDAWVGEIRPDLCLADDLDPDGDSLSYRYEVYADAHLKSLVAWGETFSKTWTVATALTDKSRYYWRARSIDEHGLEGSWMPTTSFFVREEKKPIPDEITVQVLTDKESSLQKIRVYAFTLSGSYTGVHATTEASGLAMFDIDDLTPGVYRFRADYLGGHFWSEAVTVPSSAVIPIIIEEEIVTVTTNTTPGVVSGARVYLFSETGSYLGIYKKSDANGQVFFALPTGKTFLFRTDILGSQYWSSETTVLEDAVNSTRVDAGGGRLQLEVKRNETEPIPGIKTYLFNGGGAFLGVSKTTNEAGIVQFDVTEADYKIRVDYLGFKFWCDPVHVTADMTERMIIDHQPSIVTVNGRFQDDDTPFEKSRSYLFSSEKSYLGQSLVTDEEGQAVFDLPERAFNIRVDVLGDQYWSEPFVWDDPVITIPMADAHVTVTGSGFAREGARVYVFTPSGTYLGISGTTDSNGEVYFRIPERAYDFRADYQGSQFWARSRMLVADDVTDVPISVGGGTFQLVVQDNSQSPIAGLKCYVFNENNAYLGLSEPTDETGIVGFDLSDGMYRFRVDYLGHSFWTDAIAVAGNAQHKMTIEQSAVRVQIISAGTVAPGIKVYLFSGSGTYLGHVAATDEQGEVNFDLPTGVPFQFRADILGGKYWSEKVLVESDVFPVIIDAGGGRMNVYLQTSTGIPLTERPLHLFSENGSYLGLTENSDIDGGATFAVPQGIYRIRCDYLGSSFWKEGIQVVGDTDIASTIDHGQVIVRVTRSGELVENAKVYLYSSADRYLGRYNVTDTSGAVQFILPEGSYRFRSDFNGQQKWTDIIDISADSESAIDTIME